MFTCKEKYINEEVAKEEKGGQGVGEVSFLIE